MTAPRAASTFVISITPFDDAGRLDEPGLRAHLRRLADAGIGVYLGGSGSGEGYTLTRAELRRVLEVGVDELSGRVPVRAMGVEPRTAGDMLDVAAVAPHAGGDARPRLSLDQ
jgi:4-hydroxy-tetrahydrodipicolinate synthase